MLIIKKILLSIITSLLFACSGSAPVVKPETATKQISSMPSEKPEQPATKDYPHWFKKPHLDNHISVIGSAGQQRWGGQQAQYLAAMEDAQDRLEAEFKNHQQAMQKLKNKTTSVVDQDIDEKIKKLLLHKAIVKDEWTDPKTGQLYLWLVLPNDSTSAE